MATVNRFMVLLSVIVSVIMYVRLYKEGGLVV